MDRGCKIMGTTIKTELEKRHKMKPVEFTSFAAGVARRVNENLRQRKSYRLTIHDERRKFSSPSPAPTPEPKKKSELELKTQNRRAQLLKWKEEKEKQRKATAGQKKKPFLAGVYRVPMKFEFPPPVKPFQLTMGRVTRSQTAAAKNRFIFDSKPNEKKSTKIPTIKEPVKITQVINNKKGKSTKSEKKANDKKLKASPEKKPKVASEKKPIKENIYVNKGKVVENKIKEVATKKKPEIKDKIAKKPADKKKEKQASDSDLDSGSHNIEVIKEKTPLKVPRCESHIEERLRSPKSPDLDIHLGNNLSPNITMSRGKENIRKENKQKLKDGLLAEDSSDGQTVEHYRRQLATEIARMTEMCNQWEDVMHKLQLPDTVQEQILAAVGLGRLLMGQKLQQFSSLVERCAHPEPDTPLVTATDVRGFWDLVFIQIEDVDLKFRKLEELRQREWEEPKQELPKPGPRKLPGPTKRSVKPAAPSRIRDMIAAARKAQKDQNNQLPPPEGSEGSKTFEAGFFTVQSPVRTPVHKMSCSPNNPRLSYSLLKEVVSSEAKKFANRTSYAMMRASIISKGTDIDGIAPIQFTPLKSLLDIDLDATPARSILKSGKKSTKKSKKLIKSVLFNDDEEIPEGVPSKEPVTTDSGLSSMELEDKKENKNPKKNKKDKKLQRQNALQNESPKPLRNLRSRKSLDEKVDETKESDSIVGGKSRKKKSLSEMNTESPKPLRRSSRHSVKL